MAKKVANKIKLQIPAGQARPAPPVGPALGQAGVNIGEFVKQFNDRTKDAAGLTIPVEITVFSEVLAAGASLLEIGSCLLVRASVQADGDDFRLTAQSLESLEDVARRTESGVAIHLEPPEPVTAIRAELGGNTTGSQCVKLLMTVDADREVEIALPGRFAIGPAMIGRLRSMHGVRDVVEF